MTVRRMRVFAGPNGSGKTTYLKRLLGDNKVNLGYYVNADDLETTLKNGDGIHFNDYGLKITEASVQQYFKQSIFSPQKRIEDDLWQKIFVRDNVLFTSAAIDSYLAADIAEMLRQNLLNQGLSFTYETVMSHPNKVEFMQKAMNMGYKVYLYYIATEDPDINISRVKIRIAQNGHPVSPTTIRKRYFNSLGLLKQAVKSSNRAFLFDNSGEKARLLVEINEGKEVRPNKPDDIMPLWVYKYLIE